MDNAKSRGRRPEAPNSRVPALRACYGRVANVEDRAAPMTTKLGAKYPVGAHKRPATIYI